MFEPTVLFELLDSKFVDFGRDVIPAAIESYRVCGYRFADYWEDIGTVRSFYDASLALVQPDPPFTFNDTLWPVYTRPRFLPGCRLNDVKCDRALLTDGCIINQAEIYKSLIGNNFTISGLRFPSAFIRALGLIKACAARVNGDLALLPLDTARAIEEAALAVAAGRYDDQFPVDVLQTGSGTSTNMNANEVIAELASRRLGRSVHPNDEVNRSQSTAITLLKVATDLRWMNSGPVSGLAEIRLPVLQPGSSIMPGKVNPVVPEAVGMACVQVIGLDTAVALAAQGNRFQLATMLPLIASDLLQQLTLLTGAARFLNEQAIARFAADARDLEERVGRNAMLATALTPLIGYDLAGKVARTALEEGRAVIDVARELSGLPEEKLRTLLDPQRMAWP